MLHFDEGSLPAVETGGNASRKRSFIEVEQVREAVSDSRDAETKTSPIAVNRAHAVRFYPVEVQHSSGAAHIRAARQCHKHRSVQQPQAARMSDDRVAMPDRKSLGANATHTAPQQVLCIGPNAR